MKLVDMRDSKSLVREDVPVRVRPLVPFPPFLDPTDYLQFDISFEALGCTGDTN